MKFITILCAFLAASLAFAADSAMDKPTDEPRLSTSSIGALQNAPLGAEPTRFLIHVAEVKLGQVGPQATGGINAQRPAGASAGAGLIGSLLGMLIVKGINDVRERDAQAYAERFERTQARIDLKKELEDQVRAAFTGNRYFQDVRLEFPEYASDIEQPGLLTRIQERNILALNMDYGLGGDQKKLKVKLTAKLWHKDGVAPVFTSSMEYLSEEVQGNSVSELNEQWLANNGELLISQLRSGITKTSRTLASDIEQRMSMTLHQEVEKQALK
jgi:hypothetical protein